MNQNISPATSQDAEAIASLVNSAYRGEHAKKGWTTEAHFIDGARTDANALRDIIQKPNATILKYVRDGRIISVVELRVENKGLYLGMLTVEPGIQGGGIGKEMLAAAEDFARQQNCTSVFMNVITVRDELIAWYQRHGYTDTGKRNPFPSSDPRFGLPKKELEFMVLSKSIQ